MTIEQNIPIKPPDLAAYQTSYNQDYERLAIPILNSFGLIMWRCHISNLVSSSQRNESQKRAGDTPLAIHQGRAGDTPLVINRLTTELLDLAFMRCAAGDTQLVRCAAGDTQLALIYTASKVLD